MPSHFADPRQPRNRYRRHYGTLATSSKTNTADPFGQHHRSICAAIANAIPAAVELYRTRTHVLGDIVDSAPLYIGGVNGPYQTNSYYAFEHLYGNRQPVIYVGADDGMLHAFNATTGKELFAYIPNGVYANLINLTSPYYNEQHHFYVDGSPASGDVQFSDGTWHTELVGGERAAVTPFLRST